MRKSPPSGSKKWHQCVVGSRKGAAFYPDNGGVIIFDAVKWYVDHSIWCHSVKFTLAAIVMQSIVPVIHKLILSCREDRGRSLVGRH